jgi:hypothetical protein
VAVQTQKPGALIPMLSKAGTDPYAGHAEKKAAIDILAERHDIFTLRKLDTKGLYRDLIKQYTPPANSPFVGVWWNEKDEFKTFGLILNNEGMALIETSIMPLGFFPWRTSAGNRAVIEAMEGNKPEEFIVEWLPAENALKLMSAASDETQILKKQPEKPLTVEEYRKKAQSK